LKFFNLIKKIKQNFKAEVTHTPLTQFGIESKPGTIHVPNALNLQVQGYRLTTADRNSTFLAQPITGGKAAEATVGCLKAQRSA